VFHHRPTIKRRFHHLAIVLTPTFYPQIHFGSGKSKTLTPQSTLPPRPRRRPPSHRPVAAFFLSKRRRNPSDAHATFVGPPPPGRCGGPRCLRRAAAHIRAAEPPGPSGDSAFPSRRRSPGHRSPAAASCLSGCPKSGQRRKLCSLLQHERCLGSSSRYRNP
jgi:hypothetical protein